MHTITFVKRSNDWMAFANNDVKIWGCGKSFHHAIADLLLAHGEILNIKVIDGEHTLVFPDNNYREYLMTMEDLDNL